MVMPVKHLLVVSLGSLALALPAPARAQADARISAIASGGVSAGDRSEAIYGGELAIRLTRIFDVTVGAARLSDITPHEFSDGAQTIAALVAATANGHVSANVLETGVRLRFPTSSRVRPYVAAGGGIARLTVRTTFFRSGQAIEPERLGILLGPDLNGQVTKGLAFVGGGVDVAAGPITVDAGVRYSGIVGKTDDTRFYVFPVLRLQVGVGLRF